MEYQDPIIAAEELPSVPDTATNKTQETVHLLEDEIDKAYTSLETRFQGLFSSVSKNAGELQQKYKLDEQRKHVMDQLSQVKNLSGQEVKDRLALIEQQIKLINVPEVDLKNIQTQANDALDSLDSTLEKVEQQAGKYVSQFTSFFSSMVTIAPEAEKEKEKENETVFSSPLNEYGTSRYDGELYKLHSDESYYLTEEVDDNASSFDADGKTLEISGLLKKYPSLTSLMNELVPLKISYNTFWYRYFLQEQKLKQSEQNRKRLLEKKDAQEPNDEEEFTWDDEEDAEDVAKEEAVDVGKEVKEEKESTDEEDKSDDDWEWIASESREGWLLG